MISPLPLSRTIRLTMAIWTMNVSRSTGTAASKALRILWARRGDERADIHRLEVGDDEDELQPVELDIRLDGGLLEQLGLKRAHADHLPHQQVGGVQPAQAGGEHNV